MAQKNQAERFKEDNDQECERWIQKIEGRRVKNELEGVSIFSSDSFLI